VGPMREATPAEPVRFRVTYGGPNPLYAAIGRRSAEAMVVRIARLDRAGSQAFPMPIATFSPQSEAIREAIASRAVYWVDWSRPHPAYPLGEATKLARLLDAMERRQLAADSESGPPPTE
jgi:hypothetical protein